MSTGLPNFPPAATAPVSPVEPPVVAETDTLALPLTEPVIPPIEPETFVEPAEIAKPPVPEEPVALAIKVKPIRSVTISDVQRDGVWPKRVKVSCDGKTIFVDSLQEVFAHIEGLWEN